MTESTEASGGDDNGKAKAALEAALREVDAGDRETSALLRSMQTTVIDPMVAAVGDAAASVTAVREALRSLGTDLAKYWDGLRTAIKNELRALEGGAAS
ncbi:MAG TPA: hypothetical protein VIP77_24255 [Jiangellaceae bacterium]